ncbi:MAG: dynamin family protein, partial [Bacillota bacterium]|nr:dynamin family protein [Bacillota bacterium]
MSGEMLQLAKEVGNTLNEYELCAGQAAKAKKLAAKLEHREVTLTVIGQFKRGKTTLINRIIDTELLPTGIVPITAAVTSIRCGEQRALVWLQNGLSIDVPPEELHRYIS